MKGYLAKKSRRKALGRGLHLTAAESAQGRIRKKLLAKTSWYKSRRKEDGQDEPPGAGRRTGVRKVKDGAQLKTRAALFVEQTPQGELARRLKEQLVTLEPLLGYKVRIVERTGRSLGSIFAQTNIWKGMICGRDLCVTCNQPGEDKPDCTGTSNVYESICSSCNPSSLNKGELKAQEGKGASLYVGETARSIQESFGALGSSSQGG